MRLVAEHKQQVASARIELEAALQESLDVTRAKTKLDTENSNLRAQLTELRADSAGTCGTYMHSLSSAFQLILQCALDLHSEHLVHLEPSE